MFGRPPSISGPAPNELAVVRVPPRLVHWPRHKTGNANGALAKQRVTHDSDWRQEPWVEADE